MLSFIGWEAVSHLAGELRDPARQLPRAIFAALAIVVVLYLGLAIATIGVLGTAAPSDVPLADLMAAGLGSVGRTVTAGLAVLLTMGAMNAYVAAAVQLAGALAEEGSAPAALGRPRLALALFAGVAAVLLVPLAFDVIGVDGLVRACSAAFVAVYVAATAAGVRLLEGAARVAAGVAFVAVAVVFAFSGVYLAVPVGRGRASRGGPSSAVPSRAAGVSRRGGWRVRVHGSSVTDVAEQRHRAGDRAARARAATRGAGVVGEHAVDAEREEAVELRAAVQPGREELRLGPERPRVHEQPGRVRLVHQRGRLAERAVLAARDHLVLVRADRVRVGRDLRHVRRRAGGQPHERVVRELAQRAQVPGLEGLDEDRAAEALERRQQRRLERQPEPGEVRRVLGLRVHADAGARGERDHLVERRDAEAPVERGLAQLRQPLARPQRAQLREREVLREPALLRAAVDLLGRAAVCELRPGRHVGGPGDLVLVPGDELPVARGRPRRAR